MTKPALSICFSTYGQPTMLERWFRDYMGQPAADRDRCEVIVVDDCGTPPAEIPEHESIHLFRVTKDIPWNQPGARNLAAQQAAADKLLLIDVDMTFPAGMLGNMLDRLGEVRRGHILKPLLRWITDQKLDASSPNVHLMMRQDFLDVKGYDEDFAGRKGWSDVHLLHTFNCAYRIHRVDALWLWLHHGGKIKDAQVMQLDRDNRKNKQLHVTKIGEMRKLGWRRHIAEKQGPMVRFPWQKIR